MRHPLPTRFPSPRAPSPTELLAELPTELRNTPRHHLTLIDVTTSSLSVNYRQLPLSSIEQPFANVSCTTRAKSRAQRCTTSHVTSSSKSRAASRSRLAAFAWIRLCLTITSHGIATHGNTRHSNVRFRPLRSLIASAATRRDVSPGAAIVRDAVGVTHASAAKQVEGTAERQVHATAAQLCDKLQIIDVPAASSVRAR